MKKIDTRYMVQLALLIAIQIMLAAIPQLGFISLGFMDLTIMHIPAIVGAVVLGSKAGAILGAVFGICSLFTAISSASIGAWPFNPAATGSAYSVLIAIIPRIVLGVAAAFAYKLLSERGVQKRLSAGIAGITGSLCNTLLVLGGIYLIFGERYSSEMGMTTEALFVLFVGIIINNALFEAIAAAVICAALVTPLRKIVERR